MNKFTDFYTAYHFLETHPMVLEEIKEEYLKCHFRDCLSIDVVKVNPKTQEIDDNDALNTKINVWLEFGGWCKEDSVPYNDLDLNCCGDTFEEAIVTLANLVNEKYGDNAEPIKEEEEETTISEDERPFVEVSSEEIDELIRTLEEEGIIAKEDTDAVVQLSNVLVK